MHLRFKKLYGDHTLFLKSAIDVYMAVLVYMDDIIIASSCNKAWPLEGSITMLILSSCNKATALLKNNSCITIVKYMPTNLFIVIYSWVLLIILIVSIILYHIDLTKLDFGRFLNTLNSRVM